MFHFLSGSDGTPKRIVSGLMAPYLIPPSNFNQIDGEIDSAMKPMTSGSSEVTRDETWITNGIEFMSNNGFSVIDERGEVVSKAKPQEKATVRTKKEKSDVAKRKPKEHGTARKAASKKSGMKLIRAASTGDYESVVEAVEILGADINFQNSYGCTALICAAAISETDKRLSTKIGKYLLDKNADPNIPDREGVTPLHSSAYYNNLQLVKHLVESGAKIIEDSGGYTAIDDAEENKNKEMVAILKKAKRSK
jgi:hypothetical protein